MEDEMFEELLASVREAGEIMRGEREPSRIFVVDPVNVQAIRDNLELSQADFARLMGISVKTLQNWEQGRRKPQGAARVLLLIAANNPQAIWDVVGGPFD